LAELRSLEAHIKRQEAGADEVRSAPEAPVMKSVEPDEEIAAVVREIERLELLDQADGKDEMGDMERRLERLEVLAGGGVEETASEREERLRMLKEGAEAANDRARRDGRVPPFEFAANGDVSCAHDGRPVTTYHQTLAEDWYWRDVEAGYGHLRHDAEAEAFHTHSGHLALSRYVVDLRRLFPPRP
jgi:hypothetical protein